MTFILKSKINTHTPKFTNHTAWPGTQNIKQQISQKIMTGKTHLGTGHWDM